jgi:hypothetical protein
VCDIRKTYYLATVDGETVTISREVYAALNMFMGKNKPAGSVTITFRDGGVAGVVTEQKLVLK